MNKIVLNDYRKALGRATDDNRRLIEAQESQHFKDTALHHP